ncbi:hypothetical protein T484DRAFT_1980348 [Baffinella frigidus]|nr:hypothetical protein T484DRAFT_1980348 [Cryptophyta sp. CCMP2293]
MGVGRRRAAMVGEEQAQRRRRLPLRSTSNPVPSRSWVCAAHPARIRPNLTRSRLRPVSCETGSL